MSATNLLGFYPAQNVTEWRINLPDSINLNKIIAVTNLNLGSWYEYSNLEFSLNSILVGCQGNLTTAPLGAIQVKVAYLT